MSDFKSVKLNEYRSWFTRGCETRMVIIIGESEEAAEEQLNKFAEHLSEDGEPFIVGTIEKLDDATTTHVTYTPQAWETMKQV